ncbi:MAG: cytochrome c maturation protein CcmE [Chloroflexi bacterium]|nr:cytochrome c maturation protein CcmE [Chloroflexota bacterium]MCH8221943.1 cytochrome c maturation protein CcmE [Chloroflexota bacterium]
MAPDQRDEIDLDSPDVEPDDLPDVLRPATSASASTLLSPRTKLILFAVLIAAALSFFAIQAFQNASVYYVTVNELQEQGITGDGTLVRVAGKLVSESFERADNGLEVSFSIRDEEGQVLPVAYSGEVGQLFFNDHSELILEGAYGADGVFSTETLIVKCPTKYVNVQETVDESSGSDAFSADYDDPETITEIYKANGGT